MIVEIPKNSSHKFEYDRKLGVFRLDRTLYSPMHYPGDYGFIPSTLAEDDDPLDILALVDEPPQAPGLVPRLGDRPDREAADRQAPLLPGGAVVQYKASGAGRRDPDAEAGDPARAVIGDFAAALGRLQIFDLRCGEHVRVSVWCPQSSIHRLLSDVHRKSSAVIRNARKT